MSFSGEMELAEMSPERRETLRKTFKKIPSIRALHSKRKDEGSESRQAYQGHHSSSQYLRECSKDSSPSKRRKLYDTVRTYNDKQQKLQSQFEKLGGRKSRKVVLHSFVQGPEMNVYDDQDLEGQGSRAKAGTMLSAI